MEKVAVSDERVKQVADRRFKNTLHALDTGEGFSHAAAKEERHRALGMRRLGIKEKLEPFAKLKKDYDDVGNRAHGTTMKAPMSIGAKAGLIGAGVVGAGLLARHIYKKRKARKEQQKMAASRDLNDRDLLATHQAIGAGIGLVYHAHDRYDRSTQKPGESDKRFRYRRIRNTIAGGASGSVVGAGLGTITGTAHRRARQK